MALVSDTGSVQLLSDFKENLNRKPANLNRSQVKVVVELEVRTMSSEFWGNPFCREKKMKSIFSELNPSGPRSGAGYVEV